jgi:hypothetical protein
VSAHEETPTAVFRIIANQFEDMAMFFEALAEPDRDGGSVAQETPEGGVAERPIGILDIIDCIQEGRRARKACREAGGDLDTCYVTGRLAEAACLKAALGEPEEPEKKDE